MAGVAAALGCNVVCTGETPLPDRLGRPDYAIHLIQLLAGYVELKAPGVGATAVRFNGRNRDQFKRFSAIPNILYTDGNEWALYRDGKLVDKVVRLSGHVAADGNKAAAAQDALAPRLTKGTEVYCEGRLTLGTWTGRDGEAKWGLPSRRGRCSSWGRLDARACARGTGMEALRHGDSATHATSVARVRVETDERYPVRGA